MASLLSPSTFVWFWKPTFSIGLILVNEQIERQIRNTCVINYVSQVCSHWRLGGLERSGLNREMLCKRGVMWALKGRAWERDLGRELVCSSSLFFFSLLRVLARGRAAKRIRCASRDGLLNNFAAIALRVLCERFVSALWVICECTVWVLCECTVWVLCACFVSALWVLCECSHPPFDLLSPLGGFIGKLMHGRPFLYARHELSNVCCLLENSCQISMHF